MRFVVYGAGAVGGVLGGHLALDKQDVLLICREAHASAIEEQKGLRMKSATGDYFAPLRAATSISGGDIDDETCVILTAKSYDTAACVDALAAHGPAEMPIACFQNGIDNERVAAEKFDNVYGGVWRMTCSFLHPGHVAFRGSGSVVVGRYPKGAHPYPKKLAKHLDSAGLKASVSNSILCDKWLKLVTNLQSAFNALIDDRDHDSPEFMQLKVGVLEEARRVLKADKIRAKSCDGSDLSVDELIDDLKKPHVPRHVSAVRVHNSTWQNLYLKREEIENGFFHTPVIELAGKHGIAVPHNEVALELVTRACKEQTGPGNLRAAEIIEIINDRRGPN